MAGYTGFVQHASGGQAASGFFFKGYHDLREVFLIIYMVMCEYPVTIMVRELGGARKQVFEQVYNLGLVARMWLEDKFVLETGTWGGNDHTMQADETAFTSIKRAKGPRRSKRGRAGGALWFMSMVNVNCTTKKVALFFLQRIIDNKRHAANLCWHAERLLAVGGRLVTDCHKGYLRIFQARPDVDKRSVNHSREWMNAEGDHTQHVEATHGSAKRAERRQWGGTLGHGSVDYIDARIDLRVFKMNCGFADVNPFIVVLAAIRWYARLSFCQNVRRMRPFSR